MEFINCAFLDFSRAEVREEMMQAIESVKNDLGHNYPLLINGIPTLTGNFIESIDPANYSRIVGGVAQATQKEAKQAINGAKLAAPLWADVPVGDRAKILMKAADMIEEDRFSLAAWQVYEVSKTWAEADGDVVEAIDFLRYYAIEAQKLMKPLRMQNHRAEANYLCRAPKGVVIVIPPWNFPMAILTGMTSAALVCGNTVVLKPSSASVVCAYKIVRILHRAGIPQDVLHFVPGPGREVGSFLVERPKTNMIAFTGSNETFEDIEDRVRSANKKYKIFGGDYVPHERRWAIGETGGKNAIIIDESAELDEAVIGVVKSAFGYQGQKCSACSRVIILESVYEKFLERLVGATAVLKIGHPEDSGIDMGAVIDEKAFNRMVSDEVDEEGNPLSYIETGKKEATLFYQGDVSGLSGGYFVPPTIFTDVAPYSTLAQEEIFGPVLAVIKVRNFDEAIKVSNCTPFGLTSGIYSRTPSYIERFKKEVLTGVRYINRPITGAIVGRQPFGSYGNASGTGSMAGGPDYLPEFTRKYVTSENEMRRGFSGSDKHSTPGVECEQK